MQELYRPQVLVRILHITITGYWFCDGVALATVTVTWSPSYCCGPHGNFYQTCPCEGEWKERWWGD